VLIAVALLSLSVPGMAALAFAMERHQTWLAPRWRGRNARLALRAAGITLLASALACAVVAIGWSFGVLLWLGLLTPSALAIVGVLALGQKCSER